MRHSTMPETHVANNQGFHYTRFRVNPGIARPSLKLHGGFPPKPVDGSLALGHAIASAAE